MTPRQWLRSLFLVLMCGALMAGCAEPITLDSSTAPSDGTNDGTLSDMIEDGQTSTRPPDLEPPSVEIVSPADGAVVDGSTLTISGRARDDAGIASVFVRVGENVPRLASSSDGFRSWSLDAEVAPGATTIEAIAYDAEGRQTTSDSVLVTWATDVTDSAAPVVTISRPEDNSTPLQTLVLVEGVATDDRRVVRMEVFRNGEFITERPVETDNFFQAWARLVPLLPGEVNTLVFVAHDEGGRTGQATLTLNGRAEVDRESPVVNITEPSPASTVDTDRLVVRGTASDNAGIREVKVRLGQRDAMGQVTQFQDFVGATTSDGFTTWEATLDAPAGALTVEARAIDLNGLTHSVTMALTNDLVTEWSEESTSFVRLRDTGVRPTVRLELDRQGIGEVINTTLQQELVILELDPTPLLTNAMDQIKNACGTAWQQDNSDPQHDCSLTPLGQTFSGPDGTWQTSSEYALVRLLTMTPANVVVDGTSIDGLQDIADGAILNITIGGGFGEILADTLGSVDIG